MGTCLTCRGGNHIQHLCNVERNICWRRRLYVANCCVFYGHNFVCWRGGRCVHRFHSSQKEMSRYIFMPNPAVERDAPPAGRASPIFAPLAPRPSPLRSRALCARERGASVEHRGVGRTAPANPSFERTPLRGGTRVNLRALRALRPYAGAAQLAPR